MWHGELNAHGFVRKWYHIHWYRVNIHRHAYSEMRRCCGLDSWAEQLASVVSENTWTSHNLNDYVFLSFDIYIMTRPQRLLIFFIFLFYTLARIERVSFSLFLFHSRICCCFSIPFANSFYYFFFFFYTKLKTISLWALRKNRIATPEYNNRMRATKSKTTIQHVLSHIIKHF